MQLCLVKQLLSNENILSLGLFESGYEGKKAYQSGMPFFVKTLISGFHCFQILI